MNKDEIRKKDWKLFQSKLPCWQERYMATLLKEYASLIDDETISPSYRFHELDKRIKADKSKAGVLVSLDKKYMEEIIVELLLDKAITKEDLVDFSDELEYRVKEALKRRGF